MAIQAPSGLHGYSPYCGVAPDPSTLLERWNLDPILMAVLLGLLVAYGAASTRGPRQTWIAPWRRGCFHVGWAVAAAALISPLCALSVSLFSARLGQHMVLEMIAAPLIALGLPPGVIASRVRPAATGRRQELAAAAVFAATLWFWHAPAPYAATFASDGVYWLMHVTAFGAALWLWRETLAAPGQRLGPCLAALLATTLQMGFLGALLTFAGRPFYGVHALTTWAWGLSPLQDQQLGGLIMWIPAGAIFLAAVVGAVALALRRPGAPAFAPATA